MRCQFGLLMVVMSASILLGQSSGNAEQLFDKGMNALKGTGVSHNSLNALDLIRQSADLGYAPAQVVLAYFYDVGVVVVADQGEAAQWYRRAVDQNDRLAEWLLGRLYYAGSGVPRDVERAASSFKRAADQGDAFGEYLLGEVELERHKYESAAALLRRAAEQGLPQAQWQYGNLLKEGLGTKVDKFEAYVWLLISFDAGFTRGASDLAALEAALGSTQLEQAKNRARDLERSVTRSVAAHGCTGWDGEFGAIPTPPPPDLQRFCR